MVDKIRFYELDLFRFVAAVAVMMFHYTFRGYAADNMSILEFPFLANIFKYGYLGVDLFFMISGFVILLTASKNTSIHFAISRITRLYPAFWAAVTLTAIMTVLIGGDRYNVEWLQYIQNLTMLSGYFNIPFIDGVYWTLLIELKFYFLIFILLLFNKINKIEVFLFLWLITTALFSFFGSPGYFGYIDYFLIPDWASYFIAGAFFYQVRLQGVNKFRIFMIFVSYILSLKYALGRLPHLENYYNVAFSDEIVIVIITIYYLLFILFSLQKLAFINIKSMMILGVITYPLYLIHQNIGYMLFNYFANSINKYMLLLMVISCLMIISYFIHIVIEKRIAESLKKLLDKLQTFFLNKKR